MYMKTRASPCWNKVSPVPIAVPAATRVAPRRQWRWLMEKHHRASVSSVVWNRRLPQQRLELFALENFPLEQDLRDRLELGAVGP